MSKTPVVMADVIERLFARMSATYGPEWTRQLGVTPLGDVKTVWGHELAGYLGHLDAIAHALDNLPERCPNVIQFKNLCRAAPARDVPRIDPPKADPARVRAELAKLSPAPEHTDSKEWARRILSRHAQGDRIMPYSLGLAQSAMRGRA